MFPPSAKKFPEMFLSFFSSFLEEKATNFMNIMRGKVPSLNAALREFSNPTPVLTQANQGKVKLL